MFSIGAGSQLDRIERDFLQTRDQLLSAAGSGLSLLVVIHEVEKGVAELQRAMERPLERTRLQPLVDHLTELIQGFTYLARGSGRTKERASTLIHHALFNLEFRLKHHGVTVINGIKQGEPDFEIRCTRRLIVATLMNLVDNAIYWLEVQGTSRRFLYVGTSTDLTGGPALIMADSGPGFLAPPHNLIEPFFSRKREGMGLGLYVANEVMKAHEGQLLFPQPDDIPVPAETRSAVVALQFREKRDGN